MTENSKSEQEPKEGGTGKKLVFWVGGVLITLATILALWGKEALFNKTSAVDEFKARGTVAEATPQSIKEEFSKLDPWMQSYQISVPKRDFTLTEMAKMNSWSKRCKAIHSDEEHDRHLRNTMLAFANVGLDEADAYFNEKHK